MPQIELSGILNDRPTLEDCCGFTPHTERLGRLIKQWARMEPKAFDPSLFVAINGQWGSGKTSLALQVSDWLRKNINADDKRSVEPFDERGWNYLSTWKCPTREAFLRLMVARTLDAVREQARKSEVSEKNVYDVIEENKIYLGLLPPAMRSDRGTLEFSQFIEQLETSLYQAAEETIATSARINWGNVLSYVIELGGVSGRLISALQKALNRIIAQSRGEKSPPNDELYEEQETTIAFHQVRSADQFSNLYRLATELLSKLPPVSGSKEKFVRRVIWCIDDLDRCMPEVSIDILEALKVLADSPYCCYIVPVDPLIVDAGLAYRYSRDQEGVVWFPDYRDYLEKIFHHCEEILPLTEDTINNMLKGMQQQGGDTEAEEPGMEKIARTLAIIAPNPRRVKQLLRIVELEKMENQPNKMEGQSIDEFRNSLLRAGFRIECGKKYPSLLRKPSLLKNIHDIIRGRIDFDAKKDTLEANGIFRSSLDAMKADWRFRDFLSRLAAVDNMFIEIAKAFS